MGSNDKARMGQLGEFQVQTCSPIFLLSKEDNERATTYQKFKKLAAMSG